MKTDGKNIRKIVGPLRAAAIAAVIQVLLWRPIFLWLKLLIPWLEYIPFLIITLFLSSSLFLSFSIKNRRISAIFHFIGEALFNLTTLAGPMLLIADVCSVFIKKFPVLEVGTVMAGIFLLVSITGIVNAFFIREKRYDIHIKKQCGDIRIALVSDVHLGAFSDKNMVKRICRAIEGTGADIVLVAGDMFDGRFQAYRYRKAAVACFRKLAEKCPIMCCEGNHDRFEPTPERADFVRECGIEWIEDGCAAAGDFQIVFRKDASNRTRLPAKKLTEPLDKNRPIIAVAHNPSDISELWDAGCDITLSGHTHGGQTFPGNILYKLLPAQCYGMRRKNGKTAIVTSGIGFYGIPIRFLVNNEVVILNITGRTDKEPEKEG